MSNIYRLVLSHGLNSQPASIVELPSDDAAKALAMRMIEREATSAVARSELALLVGRALGSDVTWLGAWHWRDGPEWHE